MFRKMMISLMAVILTILSSHQVGSQGLVLAAKTTAVVRPTMATAGPTAVSIGGKQQAFTSITKTATGTVIVPTTTQFSIAIPTEMSTLTENATMTMLIPFSPAYPIPYYPTTTSTRTPTPAAASGAERRTSTRLLHYWMSGFIGLIGIPVASEAGHIPFPSDHSKSTTTRRRGDALRALDSTSQVVLDEEEQERVIESLREQDDQSSRQFKNVQFGVACFLCLLYIVLTVRHVIYGSGALNPLVTSTTSGAIILITSWEVNSSPEYRALYFVGYFAISLIPVLLNTDVAFMTTWSVQRIVLVMEIYMPLIWVSLCSLASQLIHAMRRAVDQLHGKRYALKGV